MADGANSGAFSKRGTFVLVLFAILAFVAFLYLVGQGGLSGNANNGRAHAASTGLNGFAGLTRLLEADGFPVIRSRNTAALDDPGLLVLTPPAEMDAEELTKIVDRRPSGSPCPPASAAPNPAGCICSVRRRNGLRPSKARN